MGIRTVMITGDNPLTAAVIAKEAGVDDFLAEATPEAKMELIRSEQQQGKLVAMTGDGTNDAPALAQADVGVAMNTGTPAAKEAGNMVDLDSNPTKLIEIVAIGKQLLMTRGALTTFTIANDVAKYFAIIPAMFMVAFPRAAPRSTSCTCTRRTAPILSAVIFNALIIVAADPAGAARREVPADRRRGAAALQPARLRPRRRHRAVRRHQAHRPHPGGPPPDDVREPAHVKYVWTAIRMTIVTAVIAGIVYPLAMTGIAQVVFPGKADGSLIKRNGVVIGSSLIGQKFTAAQVLPAAALGGRATATTPWTRRLQPGPDQQDARRSRPGRGQGRHRRRPRPEVRPGADRHGDDLGQRARPRHHGRQRPGAGAAGGDGARHERRQRCCALVDEHTRPAVSSGSSASRRSTCCSSTWRSTRRRAPRAPDVRGADDGPGPPLRRGARTASRSP